MKSIMNTRYILAPGTQVREEDFGLLFYTKAGPRLFFLSSGKLLENPFFQGEFTLGQWISQQTRHELASKSRISTLKKALDQLKGKGVILER